MKKKLRIEKKILMGLAMFIHSFTLTKSYNMGKMVTYLKKKHADRVGGASSVWDFETTISNYFSQLFHKSGLAMIMTDYFVI